MPLVSPSPLTSAAICEVMSTNSQRRVVSIRIAACRIERAVADDTARSTEAIGRSTAGECALAVEYFFPTHMCGHLHHDEQCHDGTDGDRESGEAFEEERV